MCGWCANVCCVQGIGYETKDTVQGTLRSSTGLHGHRSGDGTVPYVSLTYCTEWRQDLELRIEELEGVEHREILSTGPHRTRTTQCHDTQRSLLIIACGCVPPRQPTLLSSVDRARVGVPHTQAAP
jgi:hypothetical protein